MQSMGVDGACFGAPSNILASRVVVVVVVVVMHSANLRVNSDHADV